MKAYIQGDVMLVRHLLQPISPDEVERRRWGQPIKPENGFLVLARGEKTGHAHRVSESAGELFGGVDNLVLSLDEETELLHEEHPALSLPVGTYFVVQQRDHDPYAELERINAEVSRARFD